MNIAQGHPAELHSHPNHRAAVLIWNIHATMETFRGLNISLHGCEIQASTLVYLTLLTHLVQFPEDPTDPRKLPIDAILRGEKPLMFLGLRVYLSDRLPSWDWHLKSSTHVKATPLQKARQCGRIEEREVVGQRVNAIDEPQFST